MEPTFAWLEPWYSVEDAPREREALEGQLRVELAPRHVLFEAQARLIGRRCDTDDALFALPDGRVAEVHLTWRRGMEEDPRWPGTAIFESLEEWARRSMRPLHDEEGHLHRWPYT